MNHYRLFPLFFASLILVSCSAQKEPARFTYQNFDEKILNYSPPKRESVSEKKTVDWKKQKLLDKENQQTVEALYQQHNTYIGRSLVGTEHEAVMWSVIQHADPEMMEKYLPVIHKAVQDGELDMGPLKMLIDRYYGLTKGYQFFGTQSGFGFENAGKEEKNKIKEMYGID